MTQKCRGARGLNSNKRRGG